MDKYQSALTNLHNRAMCGGDRDGKIIKQTKLLQKLVDKATPKKVNRVKTKSYDTYEVKIYGYCPVCDSDVFFDYCSHCGQALDWGKDDE